MKRLHERLDPKYGKISFYVILTAVAIFVILMILSYSGGFWKTLWSMFTAILKPLILGGIICYVVSPVVDKIESILGKEHKPWMRPAAVAIFYVTIVVIFVLIILTLFIVLKGSIIDGIKSIDVEAVKEFLLMLKDRFSDQLHQIEEKLATTKLPFSKVGDLFTSVINTVAGFFSGLLFGVIFSIYFMLDWASISSYWKRAFRDIAGERLNSMLEQIVSDADKVFSGYIRGQFIDALLVGVVSTVVLMIAGVPYAAVIGVLIGFGNLIPYFGPVIGYGGVIIICLVMGQYDKLVIGVIIIAVIMFIDGNVINPRLLSDNVEVHPLLVVAALLAGGAIGGLLGMLVAVPVAALLKLQLDRYLDRLEDNKTEAGELKADGPEAGEPQADKPEAVKPEAVQ